MARSESYGRIVAGIIRPVITKISEAVEGRGLDKSIALPRVGYGLQHWIARANALSDKELDEAVDGWVEIEIPLSPEIKIKARNLATDLRIIRDNSAMSQAESYLTNHDKKQTRAAPLKKIFTPDLFADSKYDEARELWVVAGEGKRFRIAVSGVAEYGLQFDIEKENWKSQQLARKEQRAIERLVSSVFARNPDCNSTDALMRKLHGWRPRA